MALSTIEEAVAQLRNGGMVVVVDDEDRENEGDLIMAAEDVTPESMAFFLEHTSGVFCVPLESERADELELPLMVVALSLIHISEPTRQAEISYAVFCLKKKKK